MPLVTGAVQRLDRAGAHASPLTRVVLNDLARALNSASRRGSTRTIDDGGRAS